MSCANTRSVSYFYPHPQRLCAQQHCGTSAQPIPIPIVDKSNTLDSGRIVVQQAGTVGENVCLPHAGPSPKVRC